MGNFKKVAVLLFIIFVAIGTFKILGLNPAFACECFDHENSKCVKYELPSGDCWVCEEGWKGKNCNDSTME